MAYRRRDRKFEDICQLAAFRAGLVLRTVNALLPDADVRVKKRIANKILMLTDGKDRSVRITQAQAEDVILPHLQCMSKECPMLCFWEPISRSLNEFFNEEG